MTTKWLLACIALLCSSSTMAYQQYKSQCNPTPFGTFCELHAKYHPNKQFNRYGYCGRTVVTLPNKQKAVLNAYLRENKNMILRFKVDDEYIDAPCF